MALGGLCMADSKSGDNNLTSCWYSDDNVNADINKGKDDLVNNGDDGGDEFAAAADNDDNIAEMILAISTPTTYRNNNTDIHNPHVWCIYSFATSHEQCTW